HVIPGRQLHGGLQRKRHDTPSASARAHKPLRQPGRRGLTANSLLHPATREPAASATRLAAGSAAACPGGPVTASSPARAGEFKPLHEINPLRTNWIDDKASLAGKEVLDVGCGGGILSEAMAQRGANVTGIDMGEAPLAVARLHQLESGVQVDYQQCTAEEMD